MKQTIIIADTIGKYDRETGRPFGHYVAFFKQYSKILNLQFKLTIGASARYKKYLADDSFNSFIPLLETKYQSNPTFSQRFQIICRQMVNMIRIFSSSGDIILFQAVDIVWAFIPLIFYFGKKRVYFVLYKDLINKGSGLKKWIKIKVFALAKRHLAGIITGTESAGSYYASLDIPILVIPDYVRIDEEYSKKATPKFETQKLYDIAVLGIHSRSKDLVDVVDTFKNTKYKVIIAGKFTDNDYFHEIAERASNCENIVLMNQYISEENFRDILCGTRYVLFPYLSSVYGHQSSGVFYDALYADKPVICTNTEFFRVVTDCNLGFVYSSTARECIPFLDREDLYYSFSSNIRLYIQKINTGIVGKIYSFLNCAQRNSDT